MELEKAHSETIRSFPYLIKSMDRGYEFTHRYQPELADLLRQIFHMLLRPLVALKARLYMTFLQPFNIHNHRNVPIFRTSVILLGFGLMYFNNISFNFSIRNPLAIVSQSLAINSDDGNGNHFARTVNEYAPVSTAFLKETTAEDYISLYRQPAIDEMKKFGIPASITLAQALIESRAGNSRLAVQNKNHFGIKCFSRNCRKGHCTNHFDDHHKDFFKKYDSVRQSYRDHSKLLQKKRYSKLKTYGIDYKKWAKGLKDAGYATDRRYDKKLIGIIKKYKLYQFDK